MSPLRLNISHVTLSCMAASSVSFLLSSTQALCAQLQNQRDYQQSIFAEPDPARLLPKNPKSLVSSVFIITNRKRRSGKSNSGFSAKRADSFSYFTATSEGKRTDAASIATNEKFDETQKKEFEASLKTACDESPSHKVVVFVHGYNSDLKVPLKLAQTLSAEMNAPVVLFSWPSKRNPFTYTEDECNAEWSAFHLGQFLDDMQRQFGNDSIVLVGHSLGCRVICWALQRAQSEPISDTSDKPTTKYSHIFFCSPDIDEQIFKMDIPMLERASLSTKVYASTRDIRLNFSKVLHGNPRLGLLKTSIKENVGSGNGHVEIIDYTRDDHSLFGHTIPFKLIAASVRE